MKNLLILLLFPTLLTAQTNRVRDYSVSCGKPTGAGTSTYQINKDTCNNVYYRWASSVWSVVTSKNLNPYGEGQQGIQGVAGRDGVCPTCPPSVGGGVFPFNIVMDNGTDNRSALQSAIDDSYNSAKPVWIIGNNFKISGGVVIPKDIKNLQVNCSGVMMATNSNTWTLFSSPVPANLAEAEDVYTNRRLVFNNIVFWGQGKAQTMFDLQASEGVVYNSPEGKDLKLGINNTFGLRTIINYPEFIHCTDDIKIQSAEGVYANATKENSAPNGSVIRDGRSVTDAFANVNVLIKDCSLCDIDGYVGEGDKRAICIDWDCVSSTSTPANINRFHFEGASPCTIAAIRIKSSTMTHVISNPNMIKPSVMVEVVPSGGGYPNVKWENVSNQRVFFDGVTPILRTAVGVGWKFENCDSPFVKAKMNTLFTGATMTESCVRENGLSRYCFDSPPN